MHARHRRGKEGGAKRFLRPGVGPGGLEIEKDAKRHRCSHDSDDCRSKDIFPMVRDEIVGNAALARIVHPTHGRAGQEADDHDPSDFDCFGEAKKVESDANDTNWQKEGPSRPRCVVFDLQNALPLCHDKGSVANEMHRPNGNSAH